jgi:hypothetical protein
MTDIDALIKDVEKDSILPFYLKKSSFSEMKLEINQKQLISKDFQTDFYFTYFFYKPIEIYESTF